MRWQKYGRVVNIGSASGKDGNPYVSAYSAAKAGLIALTKALAKETATDGVLVNCVTPSAAETEIFGKLTDQRRSELLSRVPMKRFDRRWSRSEEHTSELQSLMRISYAVFCLKK